MSNGFEKAKDYGKHFAYEGCHKIYVLKNKKEIEEAKELDYKIFPIEELEEVYYNSCSLRFINSWDLDKVFIKQFEDFEEYDYCEGCEKEINQIEIEEGVFGCPLCKCDNQITIRTRE